MSTVDFPKDTSNSCRTCLSSTSKMYNIFEENKLNNNIPKMMAACTTIKIDMNDDRFPQKICSNCYNNLLLFYNFKKLAEDIDQKLHEYFSQAKFPVKYELDDMSIKDEVYFSDDSMPLAQYNDESILLDTEEYLEQDSKDNIKKIKPRPKMEKGLKWKRKRTCKGLYTCPICLQDFKYSTNYEKHKQKHNNLKTNETISQEFIDSQKSKHVLSDCSLSCEYCGKVYRKLSNLEKHELSHKDKDNSNINKESPKTGENNAEEPCSIPCDVCSMRFRSQNSLAAHKRKHVTSDRILSCKFCGKVFKKLSHLKRHELCHEEKPFKCSQCDKSFWSEAPLLEHVDYKHRGVSVYQCPVCKKGFAHHSVMRNHLGTHLREKSYLCPTCGKRFGSSTNLKQHISRHVGVKMFECDKCPKKFVTKGELNSHGNTHTGIKRYTCDRCSATFTKGSSLKKHTLMHLGIKPFKCESCPRSFVNSYRLKVHTRVHTGEKPYKCEHCERTFSQSADLIRHKRAHFGDQIYKCEQCSEGFRLHAELTRHLSEHYVKDKVKENNNTASVNEKDFNESQPLVIE